MFVAFLSLYVCTWFLILISASLRLVVWTAVWCWTQKILYKLGIQPPIEGDLTEKEPWKKNGRPSFAVVDLKGNPPQRDERHQCKPPTVRVLGGLHWFGGFFPPNALDATWGFGIPGPNTRQGDEKGGLFLFGSDKNAHTHNLGSPQGQNHQIG